MLDWPAAHQTEVDGVPVVWASVPGPLRAGLMLRVGSADETLVTSGITHLLEHLALFGIGRPGDHSNGHVDPTTMHFHCLGDADLVTHFVGSLTRQLSDPPTARLLPERGVLRSELAGRRSSIEDSLLVWRYGAATYGLTGQSQYAVEHVDADQVRAWSAHYATRQNTVLWLSGPPPAGLRLHLPDGERRPAPDPHRTILPQLPSWFCAPDSAGVALHALVARDYAGPVLAQVLQARLVDRLRVREAMAYSPQADYRALSRDTGRLLVVSDLVDGRQGDAVPIFHAALADLSEADPATPEELAEWCAAGDRNAADPSAPLGYLASRAWNLLVGYPVDPVEQMAAAMKAVTSQDVAAAARQALDHAVTAVPDGVKPPGEPWHEAPVTSYSPLVGNDHRGLTGNQVLTVASGGLSWSQGPDQLSVPLRHAAAVLHWRDGRRVVIAEDANRIVVEPTLWEAGHDVVAFIDRHYPADLRVDMGERPADQIPHPEPPTPPSAGGLRWPWSRRRSP